MYPLVIDGIVLAEVPGMHAIAVVVMSYDAEANVAAERIACCTADVGMEPE